jgi:hypothetical protein
MIVIAKKLVRLCEGVRDVNDWWAHILPRLSSQANEGWKLSLPREVYQKLVEKIQNGGLQTNQEPKPTNGHLDLDKGGNPTDQTLYHSMIGSLLHLTASRPDIMFSVCMCVCFQANPKEARPSVVKRILRYLKHTPNIDLWYPKGATFDLVGYFNSDHGGCKFDRKSISGGCHFVGRSLVSWTSKNKIVLSCKPPKRNTLPRVLVVHKPFI